MRSQRVTITMPADEVEALRRAAAVSGAESVSAYVAEAIRGRLARDLALAKLERLIGGPPAASGLPRGGRQGRGGGGRRRVGLLRRGSGRGERRAPGLADRHRRARRPAPPRRRPRPGDPPVASEGPAPIAAASSDATGSPAHLLAAGVV